MPMFFKLKSGDYRLIFFRWETKSMEEHEAKYWRKHQYGIDNLYNTGKITDDDLKVSKRKFNSPVEKVRTYSTKQTEHFPMIIIDVENLRLSKRKFKICKGVNGCRNILKGIDTFCCSKCSNEISART